MSATTDSTRSSLPQRLLLRTALALALALAACTHGMRVVTEPPGARVVVDGVDLGVAPVEVKETPGASPHRVEVSLAGYGTVVRSVERSQVAWGPALLVLAVTPACMATGCTLGALLANPAAMAGLCGGAALTWLAPTNAVSCYSMCAGLSLCTALPAPLTAPGMALGSTLGLAPLAALWGLGYAPDEVRIVLTTQEGGVRP